MTDDQILEVVQAHKEGKQIQFRKVYQKRINDFDDYTEVWVDVKCWIPDFTKYHYRVKPEPRKPREWWIDSDASNGPWSAWTYRPCYPKDSLNERCLVHVREVIDE